ncbi:MAG TPA: endolytic transglycosylase MltG [Thermoanaerobaculia bacterium]|nr:endolytic transglycosylase MltG [Thermoanaerobaculia bacterium]
MTIGVFAVVLTIAGGWFFLRAMRTPYRNYSEPFKDVEVHHGLRTAAILKHLEAEGIIRDEYIPLIYMKVIRHNDKIKAGIYEFSKPMTSEEVLDKLIRGNVVAKIVTIREGLDRFAAAQIFVQEGFGRDREWDKLTADPELIRDIAPEAKTLEGYLFPDTYKFNPGTPPRAIVQAMVANFRKHFGGEMAYITTGLGLHQTVTLASIIETETRLPQERPLVASVYLNRINLKMLLDADPTVIYALKLAGRWDGNIRKADLQIDSPYNTYRFHGLPPGPIANPGLASLRAAAAPAKSDYLYFVAKHDGTQVFATNLADHEHNVQIYQIQWYRDQRAAQQAARP